MACGLRARHALDAERSGIVSPSTVGVFRPPAGVGRNQDQRQGRAWGSGRAQAYALIRALPAGVAPRCAATSSASPLKPALPLAFTRASGHASEGKAVCLAGEIMFAKRGADKQLGGAVATTRRVASVRRPREAGSKRPRSGAETAAGLVPEAMAGAGLRP